MPAVGGGGGRGGGGVVCHETAAGENVGADSVGGRTPPPMHESAPQPGGTVPMAPSLGPPYPQHPQHVVHVDGTKGVTLLRIADSIRNVPDSNPQQWVRGRSML